MKTGAVFNGTTLILNKNVKKWWRLLNKPAKSETGVPNQVKRRPTLVNKKTGKKVDGLMVMAAGG